MKKWAFRKNGRWLGHRSISVYLVIYFNCNQGLRKTGFYKKRIWLRWSRDFTSKHYQRHANRVCSVVVFRYNDLRVNSARNSQKRHAFNLFCFLETSQFWKKTILYEKKREKLNCDWAMPCVNGLIRVFFSI